jgi:hypothetical protein
MTSLHIDLDEGLAVSLRQLAEREQRSESEIAREAIDVFIRSRRPLPKGTGQYHSGRSDVSEQARAILRNETAEGRWP